MKYYAYCVVKSAEQPSLGGLGIDNQNLEALVVDDVAVVASEFASDIVPVTRANVLTHEKVVRSIFADRTPLPFRFGTLVTETSLRSFIHSRRKNLLSRLEAVQNCVEMSVKIIWPKLSEDAGASAESNTNLGAGTAFLRSKRQELLGTTQLNEEAHSIGSWLKSGLKELARQDLIAVEPKQRIVVSAAFLIERLRENDFKESVKELQEKRPELHFLTSGPWPPYTFANIDLEFETHFGVS